MMNPVALPQLPTRPGDYVVWTGLGRPQILYWGEHSDHFRTGCRRVPATHWLGPLPEVGDDEAA